GNSAAAPTASPRSSRPFLSFTTRQHEVGKGSVADKLGTATKPPCDDTGGQNEADEAETLETAYAVNGISPKVAIAVGDTPEDAIFVVSYSGSELPPEVEKLIDGS
ncbi:DUF6281 family protein, partial [Streptomyces cyaneofuscatus]|uniref:DUF6281 family protein n=1 Tax=Streptomyces cyaneofuscatus TaxID=66883 RepID=UPI0036575B34